MDAARARGLKQIRGEVLKTNDRMLKLMVRLDFHIVNSTEDDSVKVVFKEL